jgi:transposase
VHAHRHGKHGSLLETDFQHSGRQRKKLVEQRATAINRIQKVLEDANIKLASVATDVCGKSGWAMLERIVEGETNPELLSDLALKRLESKKSELRRTLEGRVKDHHRFLLRQHMKQIRFPDEMIREYELRIEGIVRPFEKAIPLMNTIPGISHTAAVAILAEIGPDMSQFPDHKHLCSWAGICPGNNESAGKHKSGATRRGSKHLKTVLVECAWAASRAKNTYFRAQFRRIASRRGTKRALVALAHTL